MRPVAGITFACSCCPRREMIILGPAAIAAYVSGGRFRPDTPLPDGWTATIPADPNEAAFTCEACGSRHKDLLAEARAAKIGAGA